MAKKAAKRGKTRSKKARKKAAKKSARKTAKVVRRRTAKTRRKTAKKTAKKAAKKTTRRAAKKTSRRKAAKKTARPKAAKKTARPKAAKKVARRPKATKTAAKTTRPVAPATKVAKPARLAPTPTFGDPSSGIEVREAPKPAAPAPQPKPATSAPSYLEGHYDAGIERYYVMLAQNTPESHRLGTMQIDKILAANPKDVLALAEKGHDLINNWRNGVLSPDASRECQETFGTDDIFAGALRWAQRSIAAANAANIASPYGYWAKAYAYKYQGEAKLSADNYKIARSYPEKAFIDRAGRRKKDLDAELLEGLVYWSPRAQLQTLVDKIDKDLRPAPGKAEAWINWVKCFALHLMGRFEVSNALYPDYVPGDPDVNLIIAANHARLGNEDLRQRHRRLFLEKDGNADWSADLEIERSPFTDKSMRDFWHESVRRALAPEAAPAS